MNTYPDMICHVETARIWNKAVFVHTSGCWHNFAVLWNALLYDMCAVVTHGDQCYDSLSVSNGVMIVVLIQHNMWCLIPSVSNALAWLYWLQAQRWQHSHVIILITRWAQMTGIVVICPTFKRTYLMNRIHISDTASHGSHKTVQHASKVPYVFSAHENPCCWYQMLSGQMLDEELAFASNGKKALTQLAVLEKVITFISHHNHPWPVMLGRHNSADHGASWPGQRKREDSCVQGWLGWRRCNTWGGHSQYSRISGQGKDAAYYPWYRVRVVITCSDLSLRPSDSIAHTRVLHTEQYLRITGLGSPHFDKAAVTLLSVHQFFVNMLGKTAVHEWDVKREQGNLVLDFHNQYLTLREHASQESIIDIPKDIDPFGILAKHVGDEVFTTDGLVKCFERVKANNIPQWVDTQCVVDIDSNDMQEATA